MDVMESYTLIIECDSKLLAVNNFSDRGSKTLYEPIINWLIHNGIRCESRIILHYERDRHLNQRGSFHCQLTFENDQDVSAFALRWM
jgi:hypothetical protein